MERPSYIDILTQPSRVTFALSVSSSAMSRLSVCLPGCVKGPHSQGRTQFHIAAKHPDGRLGELDDMPKKTLQHALHTPDWGTSMLLRLPWPAEPSITNLTTLMSCPCCLTLRHARNSCAALVKFPGACRACIYTRQSMVSVASWDLAHPGAPHDLHASMPLGSSKPQPHERGSLPKPQLQL
jgi:hypothetical protein